VKEVFERGSHDASGEKEKEACGVASEAVIERDLAENGFGVGVTVHDFSSIFDKPDDSESNRICLRSYR